MLATLFSCFRPKSPEVKFWNWFQRNEDRLFEFERDQQRIFKELNTELGRINPDLTFEFGPNEAGKREFAISAGGIVAAFPSVSKLVEAHPELPRWKITAFRPRRSEPTILEHQGLKVDSREVRFVIDASESKPAITLYFRGYHPAEQERYGAIGFLMLDHFLGEYDVETKIGGIEFAAATVDGQAVGQPISELASTIDNLEKKGLKAN